MPFVIANENKVNFIAFPVGIHSASGWFLGSCLEFGIIGKRAREQL